LAAVTLKMFGDAVGNISDHARGGEDTLSVQVAAAGGTVRCEHVWRCWREHVRQRCRG
jgi:hypothetical protein